MKTKVRQTENKEEEEEEEEKEEERNNVSATTLVSVLWVNFMEQTSGHRYKLTDNLNFPVKHLKDSCSIELVFKPCEGD